MADRLFDKQLNLLQRETPMIYSSLAVIALSASAAINPFTNLVHMHPRPAQTDNRVSVTLYNKSTGFQDVKVGDQVYTVLATHTLSIKAPVGTVVYAASASLTHKPGEAILAVTPEMNHKTINLQ